MNRRLRVIGTAVLWAVGIFLSVDSIIAKTLAGLGGSISLSRKQSNKRDLRGTVFGIAVMTESGFFPNNIGMQHTASLESGTYSHRDASHQYSVTTVYLSQNFKYNLPTGYSLGGWYRRYLYKAMRMIRPAIGISAYMSIDMEFRNTKTKKDRFSKDIDAYLGLVLGFHIPIPKLEQIVIVPDFYILQNLSPDYASDPEDNLYAYGYLFRFQLMVSYSYDL